MRILLSCYFRLYSADVLCRRHTHQKLVPVVWYQKLARVSVNLVPVFFLVPISGTE